ncbi:MAG: sulfatase [Pirellulaceae bacterium]|nr:sulfatase [Pirellulaceae bacterium]
MHSFRFALLLLAVAFHPQTVSSGERPNVLFISIDDLRTDLGALAVEYAQSPRLDAFAKSACIFRRHYVQVPTCGASRCALLRGQYPTKPAHVGNAAIASTQQDWASQSLPAVFRSSGYRTLALGKITHHPGGLTGKNWAEGSEELPGAWDRCWIPQGPWQHAEAIMHGYANGVARKPGKSPPLEAVDGPDETYPDAWVAAEATATLRELAKQDQPWFFAVGFFKPHLPFAAPKKWHDLQSHIPDLSPASAAKPNWPSTWHASGEFRGNYGHADGRDPATDAEYARELRRAYTACVSYTDAQIGKVFDTLHELKLDANTIVVVWSDHGFLLGEHAIWGKHCLYERALRAPLIIRHPNMKQPGATSDAIVESVDIFPTLVDLCQLPMPSGLSGRSLLPQLHDPSQGSTKPALGFWSGGQRTVRTDRWRLIRKLAKADETPQFELFDYQHDPEETQNHAAENPAVVEELSLLLDKSS